MKRHPFVPALLLVLLAGCATAPSPSSSATIASAPSHTPEPTASASGMPSPDAADLPPILQALRYAPAGVTQVDLTLLLSTMPDGLDALLAATADPSVTAAERAAFEMVAVALDHPTAANLQVGEPLCQYLQPDSPYLDDAVRAEIAAAAPLHPYEVLGIGYTTAHDPVGSIVFAYAEEADAAADLPGRTELATTGHSTANPAVTYAERFTLVDAVADGPMLVLRVAPYLDSPLFLLGAIPRRDLSFAACGPST